MTRYIRFKTVCPLPLFNESLPSGTGKPVNPDQCMTAFEDGMNTCAQRVLNMDMKVVLMVLNGQTLPPGQDAATMKKSICRYGC